jgi:hypothetical protein
VKKTIFMSITQKVFLGFLLLISSWLVLAQTAPMILAASLPASELEALNNYPSWVGNACSSAPSPTVSAGNGAPDGAAFPNLDPTSMASSIDTFIQQQNPNSALKGLGSTIVASAKNSNVNPFLIVAIAKEETSMADPSSYNVEHANNSFSREADSSQPNYPGAGPNAGTLWYKWSSVKASVDYTAPENQNASGGGDIAAYLRNEYGSAIDSSDLTTLFLKYAPPGSNNTAAYISNVKGWISTMVSGAGSASTVPNPTTPAPTSGSCSCASTTGTTLTGSDNEEKIFNYFVGKGLTPVQAAAIDGNFGQESSWDPTDAGGYLAQWGGSRLTALQQLASQQNLPVTDLGVQLDFVWQELTSDYSSTLQNLKGATAVDDATSQFTGPDDLSGQPVSPTYDGQRTGGYEDPGIPVMENRIMYASQALQKYGGSAAGGSGLSSCSGSVNCTNPSPAVGGLSQTSQNIVCIAQQELTLWQKNTMTPGFRANSSDSFSKYSQNRDELWCADFASWVYDQAGDPLQSGTGGNVSFVPNIQAIGQQNGSFHWYDSSSYTPKPGDLVIYGGSHVNIVTAINGSTMTVVGGDQNAPSPAGYPDQSDVSQYTINGFSGNGITGYVSPN